MGVVDTALEKFPFLDADRLGVLGGSYGGYMTSWIIGHTNRFKAALSERAVNSLTSMYGSSDIGWIFKQQFGGHMWDDMDAYLEPDLRFHELILEACHNELLAHMAGTMRAVFRALFVATTPRTVDTSRRATALHGDILAAVAARNGDAAERCMRELIEDTAKRLPRTNGAGSA